MKRTGFSLEKGNLELAAWRVCADCLIQHFNCPIIITFNSIGTVSAQQIRASCAALFSHFFSFSFLFSLCFRIAKHHSPRRGTSEVRCQRGFKNQVLTQFLEGWSVFNHCATSHGIGLSLQRTVRDGCWGWTWFGWDGGAQEDWKGLPGNPEEIWVRKTPPGFIF